MHLSSTYIRMYVRIYRLRATTYIIIGIGVYLYFVQIKLVFTESDLVMYVRIYMNTFTDKLQPFM